MGRCADAAFDFKGNSLGSSRQFVDDYKLLPDWAQPAPPMLAAVYVTSARYDALNRIISARAPDGSITHPAFNLAGLLERLRKSKARSRDAWQEGRDPVHPSQFIPLRPLEEVTP